MTMRPGKTVVLVGDGQADIRRFIALGLAVRGFEVLEASDAAQVLRLANQNCVDLALLDVAIPRPDGLHLCQTVRGASQVPIIVMGTIGKDHYRLAAFAVGAVDYLLKPFGVEELLVTVHAALRGRTGRELTVVPARRDAQPQISVNSPA